MTLDNITVKDSTQWSKYNVRSMTDVKLYTCIGMLQAMKILSSEREGA